MDVYNYLHPYNVIANTESSVKDSPRSSLVLLQFSKRTKTSTAGSTGTTIADPISVSFDILQTALVRPRTNQIIAKISLSICSIISSLVWPRLVGSLYILLK